MVNIIEETPRRPSFMSQLGDVLSSSLSTLPEDFANRMGQKRENRALKDLLGVDLSNLSPSIKERFASELFKRFEPRQEGDRKHPAQDVFNEMAQSIAENRTGIGIHPFFGLTGEATENRAMFNSMRSKLESVLLPMVNKGSLSKERFNFILDQIPKANERQRTQVGKLRGLSKALSEEGIPIDASILDQISWSSTKEKSKKKPLASFIEME